LFTVVAPDSVWKKFRPAHQDHPRREASLDQTPSRRPRRSVRCTQNTVLRKAAGPKVFLPWPSPLGGRVLEDFDDLSAVSVASATSTSRWPGDRRPVLQCGGGIPRRRNGDLLRSTRLRRVGVRGTPEWSARAPGRRLPRDRGRGDPSGRRRRHRRRAIQLSAQSALLRWTSSMSANVARRCRTVISIAASASWAR
jgi:hypothetical protein